MKRLITALTLLLILFGFSACSTKVMNSQAIVASDSVDSQAMQETAKENDVITEAGVQAFFDEDNEFATQMLMYPATDMTNLEEVMLMILYPLGAIYEDPITFEEFNQYTEKYLNQYFCDREFMKYATDEDEEADGINVKMEDRILYIFSGMGGQDILIESIEITENDSALITCSLGLTRDEPETMDEAKFEVQFGKKDSLLYFIKIEKINYVL